MTADLLLADLRRRGVRLEPDPGGLRYRAPRGILTDADRAALRAHRDELVALLTEEMALKVFGGSVVYRGPRLWPTWDGTPLVPARELFPSTTTITETTTRATEAVQGGLEGLAGPRST